MTDWVRQSLATSSKSICLHYTSITGFRPLHFILTQGSIYIDDATWVVSKKICLLAVSPDSSDSRCYPCYRCYQKRNIEKLQDPHRYQITTYGLIKTCWCHSYFAIDTLRPRQNGHHFADDIFTCIFFNENLCILIWMSLKFICKVTINNESSFVQIMAWHWTGNKPLSERMIA